MSQFGEGFVRSLQPKGEESRGAQSVAECAGSQLAVFTVRKDKGFEPDRSPISVESFGKEKKEAAATSQGNSGLVKGRPACQ